MADSTATPGIAVVHLMKTGGTSLADATRPKFTPDACFPAGERTYQIWAKSAPPALLDLPLEQRAQLRFVSVHMPAWVVQESVPHLPTVTVLREPVQRTVSHLRQIKRYAYPELSLEELWHHPLLHRRLTNYQTQMFAATRQHRAPQDVEIDPATLTDAERQSIVESVAAMGLTGVQDVLDVEESDLRRAADRLASIDIVGTTNSLNSLLREVGRRLATDLGDIRHRNRGSDAHTPNSDLERQIADACQADAELFELAQSRSATAS